MKEHLRMSVIEDLSQTDELSVIEGDSHASPVSRGLSVIEDVSQEQNWAKFCRNPMVGHDWFYIVGLPYIPKTAREIYRIINQECNCCHLIKAVMWTSDWRRFCMYDESTRPKNYSYAVDEEPTPEQYLNYYIDGAEERERRSKAKPRTRAVGLPVGVT